VLFARVLANGYRADLAAAAVGDGRHGFAFDFPRALALEERHVIRVCREVDGADIERSPVVLEPAEYSDVIKPALVDMLARRSSAEELERTIELLVEHVDKSLQQLAERRAGRVERDEYRHFLERWRRRRARSQRHRSPQRRCRRARWSLMIEYRN
jgi:O-antigen biosynthesis protein